MIYGDRNFQMSTMIFHYGLTPYEPAIYGYLAPSTNQQKNAVLRHL